MNGPGQKFKARSVSMIAVDHDGNAHAWGVNPALVSWEMIGLAESGRTKARVVVEGAFRRQTKQISSANRAVTR